MKSWKKIAIGVAIVGGVLAYFIHTTLRSSWSYYLTVDDFAQQQPNQRAAFRLTGTVAPGSVSRDVAQMLLTFNLAGKQATQAIAYRGAAPDNFAEGRDVVVEGQMDEKNVFQAQKLLTRCESKYEAK